MPSKPANKRRSAEQQLVDAATRLCSVLAEALACQSGRRARTTISASPESMTRSSVD